MQQNPYLSFWGKAGGVIDDQPSWHPVAYHSLEPEAYDCVAIVTAHTSIDYADVVRRGKVIVDFRNATKGHEVGGKVWKL